MFLGRIHIPFIGEHLQGVYQARAGLSRLDDIVNIPTGSRYIWVRKFLAVFRYQLFFTLYRVFSFSQLFAENNLNSPIWTHDGQFRTRPG